MPECVIFPKSKWTVYWVIFLVCSLAFLYKNLMPHSTVFEVHIGRGNHVLFESWNQSHVFPLPTEEILSSVEEGCKIPKLTPGDQNIFDLDYQQFITYGRRERLPCASPNNSTYFTIDFQGNLKRLHPSAPFWTHNTCFYRILQRTQENGVFSYKLDKKMYAMSEDVIKLPPHIETLLMSCNSSLSRNSTYIDYVSQVILLPQVEEELKLLPASLDPQRHPSVLIFGMDSLSHMNFRRYMPKVHEYLLKDMDGVEFNGFNSVGDHTPVNLFPLFSGQTLPELLVDCTPHFLYKHDDCSLIWREFIKMGYRISYSEDAAYDPSLGFRPFHQEKFHYDFRLVAQRLEGIWKRLENKTEEDKGCYGNRLAFDVILENFLKTATTFASHNKPVWHFSWTSELTHDINLYTQDGETSLLQTLQYVHQRKLLNNTILILMSDHGMRFGQMRQKTKQGFLEERLPMLYVVLPPTFNERFPTAVKNLKENAEKVVTAFDLHTTMRHILNLTDMEEANLRSTEGGLARGVSLFRGISEKRSCDMIGIPSIYCACMHRTNISSTHPFIQYIAQVTVDAMNQKLEAHGKCEKLQLLNITTAVRLDAGTSKGSHDRNSWLGLGGSGGRKGLIYEVQFETSPGGGVFYVSVFHDSKSNAVKITDINRISSYGSQADCLNEKELKPFCLCMH